MTQQLSGFDLGRICQEIAFLENARIEKVRDHKHFFTIEIYVPTVGKQFLYIQVPRTCFLSAQRPESESVASHFCSSLRTFIHGARIVSIGQSNFDRILQVDLEEKEKTYRLVIELFSQGNMLLLDGEGKILAVAHPKKYSATRQLLPGRIYELPASTPHPASSTVESFVSLCIASSRPTIAHILAMDLGLGGTYAKHILRMGGIDDRAAPKSLSRTHYVLVHQLVKDIFSTPTTALVINDTAYPFPLAQLDISTAVQYASFNEAVAATFTPAPPEPKISEKERYLLRIIEKQNIQFDQITAQAQEYQEQGEFIYTNYQLLERLFSIYATERTFDPGLIEKLKEHGIHARLENKTLHIEMRGRETGE